MPHPENTYLKYAKRARILSWISLFWVGGEGIIGVASGIIAGSIALIGFGIDSVIEGFASLIIVWRFSGKRMFSDLAETQAQKLIAIQFFLLAPYVAVEAAFHLANQEKPELSIIGMILTFSSLIGMPILGIAKQRLARQLNSAATHGEGAQNLLCAYLAGAVFLGLLGNALLGWWWLDPLAAFCISGIAVKEGVQALRGDACCAPLALEQDRLCAHECTDQQKDV